MVNENPDLDARIEHRFIKTNGITLHTVCAGPENGPLVIMLHGFPEYWYGWRHQLPFLSRRNYRVLLPDQRGYNLSDKPARVSDYAIDLLADDVIGLIDAAGRERAVLVGHDWGGAVAWRVAGCYPQRLQKLIILNMPHPAVMKKSLRQNWTQRRKSWYILFFQIPWLPQWLLRGFNYTLAARALTGSSRPGTFSQRDLQKYREAWSQPGALRSMINWYRAIFKTSPRKIDTSRIVVPTLLIWGTEDRFLSREMAQPSIERCINGKLVFLEGVSHWVQHEEAERVNGIMRNFLENGLHNWD